MLPEVFNTLWCFLDALFQSTKCHHVRYHASFRIVSVIVYRFLTSVIVYHYIMSCYRVRVHDRACAIMSFLVYRRVLWRCSPARLHVRSFLCQLMCGMCCSLHRHVAHSKKSSRNQTYVYASVCVQTYVSMLVSCINLSTMLLPSTLQLVLLCPICILQFVLVDIFHPSACTSRSAQHVHPHQLTFLYIL